MQQGINDYTIDINELQNIEEKEITIKDIALNLIKNERIDINDIDLNESINWNSKSPIGSIISYYNNKEDINDEDFDFDFDFDPINFDIKGLWFTNYIGSLETIDFKNITFDGIIEANITNNTNSFNEEKKIKLLNASNVNGILTFYKFNDDDNNNKIYIKTLCLSNGNIIYNTNEEFDYPKDINELNKTNIRYIGNYNLNNTEITDIKNGMKIYCIGNVNINNTVNSNAEIFISNNLYSTNGFQINGSVYCYNYITSRIYLNDNGYIKIYNSSYINEINCKGKIICNENIININKEKFITISLQNKGYIHIKGKIDYKIIKLNDTFIKNEIFKNSIFSNELIEEKEEIIKSDIIGYISINEKENDVLKIKTYYFYYKLGNELRYHLLGCYNKEYEINNELLPIKLKEKDETKEKYIQFDKENGGIYKLYGLNKIPFKGEILYNTKQLLYIYEK